MTAPRLELLANRVAEAVGHAPALADRLAAAGLAPADLARPGALDRLPVLAKSELVARQEADPPFGGFLGCDLAEAGHVFVSPGPIFEPVAGDGAMGMEAMFAAAGIGRGDVALNTWSYHLVPAGLLFDRGLRAVGATVIPSGPGQTELQCRLIATMGVTAFLGSTAYFETVATAYAQAHGATAGHWRLAHAFLGGEPGDWAGKRARLEAEHGLKTHGCYATADLGLVGHEDGGPGYVIHPERLVQICDPASGAPLPAGEAGEVVVSTLARGWPMLRLGTGDLARALALGEDGFVARMGPVEGRCGAGVKVREIFLYPHHADALAARLGPGAQARIAIARTAGRDAITLEVAGTQAKDAAIAEAFRALTRLRPDRIRRLGGAGDFTIESRLADARDFGAPAAGQTDTKT